MIKYSKHLRVHEPERRFVSQGMYHYGINKTELIDLLQTWLDAR